MFFQPLLVRFCFFASHLKLLHEFCSGRIAEGFANVSDVSRRLQVCECDRVHLPGRLRDSWGQLQSRILLACLHNASSMLPGRLPYNKREGAQKTTRGLFAEGSRKDGRPVRGRIADNITKQREGCSAEGSRKAFFRTLIWHDFAEAFSRTAEGLRKVPGWE